MTEPAELPPRAAISADASPAPARAKKKRRRLLPAACACATPEACFACGRCLEQHCVCGAASSAHHQALCRASRACNCRVQAPASARCERCLGCRQTGDAAALSHCRCLAHQQQLRRLLALGGADVDDKKPGDDDGAACGCFQDRPRRRSSVTADPRPAIERRREIARVKRRAGLPSSRGLYEQKIVAPGVGVDGFGEDCAELSDDKLCDSSGRYGHARATAEEELLDMVPAAYVETSRPRHDAHEPQKRLSWSRSQPFQQAIAALPTSHEREATVRPSKNDKSGGILTEQSINRSLENAMYERDREAAMPSENLVDYLIFAASVKASRIPELIGTFDDTAATALGIVTEEYMKQLVVRSVREPLCVVTRRSIQAFASTILRDFEFAVYLDKCGRPALAQLSENETRHVVNELAHLVCDEFMALQHPSGRYTGPPPGQILSFIGEVVVRELELARTPLQDTSEPPSALDVTNLHKLKALKLSQHTSKVTGQRIYKYEVSADVGTKHRAKVVVDGFESRESAEQSIKRMHRTLEKQDKRLSQIENPPPRSPPKVAEDPIVKDPMVKELYEQLLNQVRQSRTATRSKAPTASELTGDSSDMLEHDKPAPAPEQRSTAAVGVAEAQQ